MTPFRSQSGLGRALSRHTSSAGAARTPNRPAHSTRMTNSKRRLECDRLHMDAKNLSKSVTNTRFYKKCESRVRYHTGPWRSPRAHLQDGLPRRVRRHWCSAAVRLHCYPTASSWSHWADFLRERWHDTTATAALTPPLGPRARRPPSLRRELRCSRMAGSSPQAASSPKRPSRATLQASVDTLRLRPLLGIIVSR